MQVFPKKIEHSDVIVKLLPLMAFAAPMALLFILNPADPYLQVNAQGVFSVNVERQNIPAVLHLARSRLSLSSAGTLSNQK